MVGMGADIIPRQHGVVVQPGAQHRGPERHDGPGHGQAQPAEHRARWLAAACDQPHIRAEVESLLAASENRKAVGMPELDPLIKLQYRKGWTLT